MPANGSFFMHHGANDWQARIWAATGKRRHALPEFGNINWRIARPVKIAIHHTAANFPHFWVGLNNINHAPLGIHQIEVQILCQPFE